VKRVSVFNRYVVEGSTRAIETESGERNRRAVRDACNECRNVWNSEPLAQKLSISHGGFTRRAGHATAPLPRIAPMAFRLETLQLLARSIAAPSTHRIRVLTTHIIANDSLLCSADGCLLLLIVVRSRSTSGLRAWILVMLVVIATSFCEYARKLASLFGARTAPIKLKLQ